MKYTMYTFPILNSRLILALLAFFTGFVAFSQSWSPDQKRLLYVSDRYGSNEIFEIKIDGTEERQISQTGYSELHPSYSCDGKYILFDGDPEGNRDLFLLSSKNNHITRLTNHKAPDLVGVFGKERIFFNTTRDGNSEIYSMNLDGSDKQNLSNHKATDIIRSLSWDKTKILFDSDRPGRRAIYQMNIDGEEVKQLTFPDSTFSHRIAMPDPKGGVLYSASSSQQKEQIEHINSEGMATIFMANSGNNFYPHWSPNGKYVAFISDKDGARDVYLLNPKNGLLKKLTENAITNFKRK